MLRHSNAKVRIPAETMSGAPTHTPMSFHAVPGPAAAATVTPSGFTHMRESAAGPRKSARKKAQSSSHALGETATADVPA